MSKTSLFAGGAGFLGSHLCASLLNAGREVVCVDNLGSGRRANLDTVRDRPGFEFREADVRECVDLPPADEIYHLASRASPADFT